MSAITAEIQWLWTEMHKLEPGSELGGIYANKRGYHNMRQNLPSTDYSVAQFSVDRQGPDDKAAAIDWTFPDAQAGRYATISKYAKRLLAAGQAGRSRDPRTVYMREFFGQTDSDSSVEGWDYAKARTSTSDSSHLWHIHISIHRKYVTSMTAMRAILSILKGETVAQWLAPDEEDELNGAQNNALAETWTLADALRDGTSAGKVDSRAAGPVWLVDQIKAANAALAGLKAQLAALSTVLNTLAEAVKNGGGSIDTAAVLARIDGLGTQVADLTKQLQDAEAERDALRKQLAEALAGGTAS